VGGCYIAPGALSGSGFIQAAGFPLANASKWVYNLGLQYTRPVGSGLVADGTLTYNWRSRFFNVGYDPNTRINAYGVMGLNIGVGPASGAWRFGVFARNLLNQ
jgi:iron complex outermembrane receptor protein